MGLVYDDGMFERRMEAIDRENAWKAEWAARDRKEKAEQAARDREERYAKNAGLTLEEWRRRNSLNAAKAQNAKEMSELALRISETQGDLDCACEGDGRDCSENLRDSKSLGCGAPERGPSADTAGGGCLDGRGNST